MALRKLFLLKLQIAPKSAERSLATSDVASFSLTADGNGNIGGGGGGGGGVGAFCAVEPKKIETFFKNCFDASQISEYNSTASLETKKKPLTVLVMIR